MTFDDVIGQEHITSTIKNEILTGKISHAYLFTGTRGTGKTSTAKIFSRAVNCLNPTDGNPCNECDICKGIINERILDVIEIDAASNTGVDNIRDIIDQTRYAASESRCRVYIIDEVHMLSAGAFNALLKTLEEPTDGVIFILATTEIHKVPATIMSRCQRFDFKTINITDITSRIKYILSEENITAEDEAVHYVAQLGDGSMRDSLSILDQCLAFKSDNLTYDDVVDTVGAIDTTFLYDIACKIADGDAAGAVGAFEHCIADGKNTDYFAEGLLEVYRTTLLYKISGNLDYAGLRASNTQRTADKYTTEKLMHCVDVIAQLLGDIKYSSSPKVYIEMALIKMAHPALDDSNSAILARISKLESDVKSGNIAVSHTMSEVVNIPDFEQSPVYTDEELMENAIEYIPDEIPAPDAPPAVEDKQSGNGVTVCDNWSEVENAIMNDGGLTLYMSLRGVRPTPAGDDVHLVFETAEQRDACAKGNNKSAIEGYIRTVFGFDVNVDFFTKNNVPKSAVLEKGDFFGKIEQFSREFPENIELGEN